MVSHVRVRTFHRYNIQVGAHVIWMGAKAEHRRFDAITVSVPITHTTTLVTSPVGGNLYIMVRGTPPSPPDDAMEIDCKGCRLSQHSITHMHAALEGPDGSAAAHYVCVRPYQVPYLADAGVVEIKISGGVRKAPHFRKVWFDKMTNSDWDAQRAKRWPNGDGPIFCNPRDTEATATNSERDSTAEGTPCTPGGDPLGLAPWTDIESFKCAPCSDARSHTAHTHDPIPPVPLLTSCVDLPASMLAC